MDVLKRTSQRPAALASLPVVPKKRCIFNIHCPREPMVPTSHSNRGNNRDENRDRDSDRDRIRGTSNNIGNICSDDENENINGIIRPSSNTPLVIEPSGVYFRPEGSGGKYIAGVSPSAEQVRILLTICLYYFTNSSTKVKFIPYLPVNSKMVFVFLTLISLLFISFHTFSYSIPVPVPGPRPFFLLLIHCTLLSLFHSLSLSFFLSFSLSLFVSLSDFLSLRLSLVLSPRHVHTHTLNLTFTLFLYLLCFVDLNAPLYLFHYLVLTFLFILIRILIVKIQL